MAGAQAVCARISASDDKHALAFGVIEVRRQPVAFATVILLRQELHREVNAFKLTSGDIEIARVFGATSQQNRIVVACERFHRHIAANMGIGKKRHAFSAHLIHAAIDYVLLKLEVRNAVA